MFKSKFLNKHAANIKKELEEAQLKQSAIVANIPDVEYPTPSQTEAITKAFGKGFGLYEACNVAKVHPKTFYNWLFLADYLDNFEPHEALALIQIREAWHRAFQYRASFSEAGRKLETKLQEIN